MKFWEMKEMWSPEKVAEAYNTSYLGYLDWRIVV
jgi:hypothetical protein